MVPAGARAQSGTTCGIPFSTRVAFNGDPVYVKILVYDFARA